MPPVLPRLQIFGSFLSNCSISEFKVDISAQIVEIFWPHSYFTTFISFFTFVCPQLPLHNFDEIFSPLPCPMCLMRILQDWLYCVIPLQSHLTKTERKIIILNLGILGFGAAPRGGRGIFKLYHILFFYWQAPEHILMTFH